MDPAGLGAQVGGGGGGARHHWRPHARGGARAGADGAVHGQCRCGHGYTGWDSLQFVICGLLFIVILCVSEVRTLPVVEIQTDRQTQQLLLCL